MTPMPALTPDVGPRRLTVELTNICNLHCSYCLRDEDALHHRPASFLPLEVFTRVASDAREWLGIEQVSLTGGEPTLHPAFADVLASVERLGLTCSFVTNGWHFDRVWPHVMAHRGVVTHVAFSLDGTTRDAHDRWRGAGSFDRLVRAISRCWAHGLAFTLKVVLRRDTVDDLERFAIFAARLGADRLSFAHVMPTSGNLAEAASLTIDERELAEREVAVLARMFRMPVRLDVGYVNADPAPPCSPLAGASANVDYRGRLTLCCNLSGFRGAQGESDVVGDLTTEPLAAAAARLRDLARAQLAARAQALAALGAGGASADLSVGSPCLFCLKRLTKAPWLEAPQTPPGRVLPLVKVDR